MDAQDVMMASRIASVREMRAELARLRALNARLAAENEELLSHFREAVAAASGLALLPEGGRLLLVDGWNLVLGADREAPSAAELEAKIAARLEERPCDRAWIIYDGPRAGTAVRGRMKITYTGGTGVQRADRLMCDFVRTARFSGLADRIAPVTRDKALAARLEKLLSE